MHRLSGHPRFRGRFRSAADEFLMPSLVMGPPERPLSAVPLSVKAVLVIALAANVTWASLRERPNAHAAALARPADVAWLRAASFGEPIAFAEWMTLYLQA